MTDTKKRVVLTGGNPELAAQLEPMLNRDSLEVFQLPLGRVAAIVSRKVQSDYVIVMDPLPDVETRDFIRWMTEDSGRVEGMKMMVVTDDEAPGWLDEQNRGRVSVASNRSTPEQLRKEIAGFLEMAPRAACRLMVSMEVRLSEGKVLRMAQTENVSATGMLLRTDHPFPIGSRLSLRCDLPYTSNDSKTIVASGEVVRHTNESIEGIRGVGLRFLSFRTGDERVLQEFLDGLPVGASTTWRGREISPRNLGTFSHPWLARAQQVS